ncbi:ankyrin repeat-containing domain protein [Aspergillus pseudonomiae]|uniref:Ankyrin repeat-containing domain protein n=1 Tax=Aspergillus pseudonomiae TaxID=1506151 RepID=A0A5N7DKY5_9EURO|nr:ankyrin repeat-containing domain protein [Aspergillus pseudonomiae]KAE8407121.1 ankyrin repeat-containing domain protein [Aspergillus pseudonomiae]
MLSSNRTYDDYTVGWICALHIELTAAMAMLDVIHPSLPPRDGDDNHYTLGQIGTHNVAVACLPAGLKGTNSAATVAAQMRATFGSIGFGLLVGIGGGVPSDLHDIRLGDVVVGMPGVRSGGIIQYDFGKTVAEGKFVHTGYLNTPPVVLLTAMNTLRARLELSGEGQVLKTLSPNLPDSFSKPSAPDQLFKAEYSHVGGVYTCQECDSSEEVARENRQHSSPFIHYGTIASGNEVMRDGRTRDRLRDEYEVLCFEMEAAGLMNTFPCAVVRGICDYADSHKTKRWQSYAAATAAAYARDLLFVVDNTASAKSRKRKPQPDEWNVGSSTKRRMSRVFKEEDGDGSGWTARFGQISGRDHSTAETKCLAAFDVCAYKEHKNRNDNRYEGTCEWFLQDPKFIHWRDSAQSSLLWVSADPGCGKSVLAKSLIDGELRMSTHRTTCFFFFKDDNPEQSSLENALCAILHQLFSAHRNLIKCALPDFNADKASFVKSAHRLWEILLGAIRDTDSTNFVFIIDALDECERRGRHELIERLTCLHSESDKRFSRAKFLVTSRPHSDIERRFESYPSIRLAGEEKIGTISDEIDVVITEKLNQLQTSLDPEIQRYLREKLQSTKQRTYLWVRLIFQMIEEVIDERYYLTEEDEEVRGLFESLPASVDQAYSNILQNTKKSGPAVRILGIVLAATRPLTVRELNVALSLKGKEFSPMDVHLVPEREFRIRVRNLCSLFVTVVDSKVYLIHHTARDFLMSTALRAGAASGWKGSISLSQSHQIIMSQCAIYLRMPFFDNQRIIRDQTLELRHRPWSDDIAEDTHPYPFLDYAAKNWVNHLHASGRVSSEVILLQDLCHTGYHRFQTWFQIYWSSKKSRCPRGFTDLIAAAYFGFADRVKALLEEGANKDEKDLTYGRSPLLWAAYCNQFAVVQLLLGNEVNRNLADNEGRTATSLAAEAGAADIVAMLVRVGSDLTLKDLNGWCPLMWAVDRAQISVAKVLMDHKVDISSRDRYGKTSLWVAVEKGNDVLLEALLQQGADPNIRVGFDQTPLSSAIGKCQRRMVKLLLDHGAEVKSTIGFGTTTVCLAAEKGDLEITRLLVQKGADPSAPDRNGQTAIMIAAEHGHEGVFNYLLQKGVSLDSGGQTPLFAALKNGHESIADRLIRKLRATSSGTSIIRKTMLQAAAQGLQQIVEFLYFTALDIGSRQECAMEALTSSISSRHMSTVRFLLDQLLGIDMQDYGAMAPILMAIEYGNYEHVQRVFQDKVIKHYSTDTTDEITQSEETAIDRRSAINDLLQHGWEPARSDKDGNTMLEISIIHNWYPRIAWELLQLRVFPADILKRCARRCVREGHPTALKALLQYSPDEVLESQIITDLFKEAIDKEDVGTITLLISFRGKSDSILRSLYLRAIKDGLVDMASIQIEEGGFSESQLNELLSIACVQCRAGIVKALLSAGAGAKKDREDPNVTEALNASMKQNDTRIMQLLLKGGTYPTKQLEKIMLWACHHGFIEIVEPLLHAGVCPTYVNEQGDSPVSMALMGHHDDIVKLLSTWMDSPTPGAAMAEGNVTKANQERSNPNIWSAAPKRIRIVDMTRIEGDYRMQTSMMFTAIRFDDRDLMADVLQSGIVNLDLDDDDRRTNLFTPLTWAVWSGNLDIVQMLLDSGVNPNTSGSFGETAVSLAIRARQELILKLLIAHGAYCNFQDKWGKTPLVWAARYNTPMIPLLLERGFKNPVRYISYLNTTLK